VRRERSKRDMDKMLPGEQVVVRKLNTRGEPVTSYEAVLEELLPSGVLLSARWTRPPLALGYTTFETGDRFREWFFTDRWYNIFAIAGEGSRHKGWYCNIAEPAHIEEGTISSRDLLLDLWVDCDYRVQVLDEDEFLADQYLTSDVRALAQSALAELTSRIRLRLSPFSQA
jgi:hypothetical protein